MDPLRKIDDLIARLEKSAVVILFVALALVIFINTLARNLWGISSQRALELIPVIVLWLTLCGATLALRSNRHIRLELVLKYLPHRLQRMATAATHGFALLVMAILFWAAVGFVQNERAMFGVWGWTTVIFPFFFGVAALRFAIGLTQALKNPGSAPRQPRN